MQQPRLTTGLAVAVLSVAAITGAIFGLREAVPVLSTGVVYLLGVLLVSGYWGLGLGMATAFLSAAAFNFFHIPPTGEFTIADGENWVALGVFFVAAVVTGTLAEAARRRAEEADQRRREADLAAEMARLLLSGASTEASLSAVGQRIAKAYDLPSVSLELAWSSGDDRRRALPLLADGQRAGTLLVPTDTDEHVLEALQDRVVPSLEALIGAAAKREELETQVVETKALRRSNVVKTTLLRSISHDLRTPLTAITTAAGGLGSDTLSAEERAELAAVISEESDRLSQMVENLLDLTRLQSGAAEPRADWCSVDELVAAAVHSVPAPPGGFDVELGELPLIQADASQLERALDNVLGNAAELGGDEAVTIRARVAGQMLNLRVSDRGPGIPKEELERVFEPFYRARGSGAAGSGLGLAIARGFVEANGGRLRAESLPGQGTTFVFQLPVPVEAPRAMSRVLVCDDEPQILRALKVILRDEGFEVIAVATAEEALDAVAVRPPDAAILDLILPDGDGIEITRSIREWSEMPILVLSAVGDEAEKVRALDAGADDYVTKPFGPPELVARLKAAMRRARPAEQREPVMETGGLRVDFAARRVEVDGEEVHLTPIEFDLLRTLANNRGRLMTHRVLLTEVWGSAYEHDTQVLRVHIANLRKKIGPDHIRTDPGVGYRFGE